MIVVTGAGGYLGGRVCARLKSDVDVRAVVRRVVPWLACEQVEADLVDADLAGVVRGAAAVVHLAGANEVTASADPDAALHGTITGTRRLAQAAADAGVPRVVYVSTVHVYGAALAGGALVTESTLPAPRHPYAIARLAAEHLLASAGLDAVVLRLTNSVGAPVDPRVARWTLVANELCREAAVSGRVTLRTSGQQWRDFVHQDDVCRVVAAALDASRVPAGTYNLALGTSMTVRALAELVQDTFERLTGCRPALHAPAATEPAPAPYTVSGARLAALGLAPELDVAGAIAETAAFCLDHRSELADG